MSTASSAPSGSSAIEESNATHKRKFSRAMVAVWIAMALCWLAQGLATRHAQQAADGISYMEIAQNVVAGNWHALLNSYWSPGYPLVLGAFLKIFNPSPAHELLLMRLVAWLSLLASLAAFEYFLRTFLRFRMNFLVADPNGSAPILSDRDIRILGYGLFFWCTTVLVPASNEHPDILVLLILLLSSALAMDLVRVRRGYLRHALFGAVLGLGYLVKAILYPLAFFFFVALLVFRSERNWKFVVAFITFVLVCLPLILGLSLKKGRFTVGDTGPVARAQTMSLYDFGNMSPGVPVAAAPHIQIYSGPMWKGSYPPWTEPSILFTGTFPHVPLRQQLNKTHIVLRFYFDLLATSLGALTCGLLILALLQRSLVAFVVAFLRQTVLWLPAFAGLGAYATLRVEGRFLPGLLILIFAALCGALVAPKIPDYAQVAKYVVYAATILLVLQSLAQAGHTPATVEPGFPDSDAAAALPHFGVAAGDKVAFLGDGLQDHLWAHLARVEIVGEIPKDDVALFWAATPVQKAQALQQLAAAGAKGIVTQNVPATSIDDGWQRLGDSPYYLLDLAPNVPRPPDKSVTLH